MVAYTYVAPSSIVDYLSVGLGAFMVAQGSASIVAPVPVSMSFGIPLAAPSPTASTKTKPEIVHPAVAPSTTAMAYCGVYGARNISIGAMLVGLTVTGQTAALALLWPTLVVVTAADTYFTATCGASGSWVTHAAGVAIALVASYTLLK